MASWRDPLRGGEWIAAAAAVHIILGTLVTNGLLVKLLDMPSLPLFGGGHLAVAVSALLSDAVNVALAVGLLFLLGWYLAMPPALIAALMVGLSWGVFALFLFLPGQAIPEAYWIGRGIAAALAAVLGTLAARKGAALRGDP